VRSSDSNRQARDLNLGREIKKRDAPGLVIAIDHE
jgi:hypothetical protein